MKLKRKDQADTKALCLNCKSRMNRNEYRNTGKTSIKLANFIPN